jgi:hypothetical protein
VSRGRLGGVLPPTAPEGTPANGPPALEVLAVRTGAWWTAVVVDPEADECRVPRMGGPRRAVAHPGITDAAICRAALDPRGRSYRTLGSLRIAHPEARRRPELDWREFARDNYGQKVIEPDNDRDYDEFMLTTTTTPAPAPAPVKAQLTDYLVPGSDLTGVSPMVLQHLEAAVRLHELLNHLRDDCDIDLRTASDRGRLVHIATGRGTYRVRHLLKAEGLQWTGAAWVGPVDPRAEALPFLEALAAALG